MNNATSLLKALALVWYSPTFYTEVYQSWRGRIFSLLALLCILTGTACFIKPFKVIHEVHLAGNSLLQQLPTLHFDDHCLLSINTLLPYLIKSPTSGHLLIVFDTTADQQKLAAYPALLFSFGSSGFYVHNDATQAKPLIQFTTYQTIAPVLRNLTLTPEQSIRLLNYLMLVIQIILYGFSVLALFATKAVTGLLAAFIAMPMAFFYRLPLSLSQAFRIGILALIPATCLEFLYNCLLLTETTELQLALSAISLSYICWIIRSTKKQLAT